MAIPTRSMRYSNRQLEVSLERNINQRFKAISRKLVWRGFETDFSSNQKIYLQLQSGLKSVALFHV